MLKALTVSVAAFACCAAHAAEPYSVADFEKEAGAAVKDGLSPALAFAIVDERGVQWVKGFGLADAEQNIRADADTVFTMGSVSKTFIGAAAAIAAVEGKLDPKADINDYLSFAVENPNVPDAVITFETLTTHTSGILDNEAVYETAYAFGETVYPQSLRDWIISYVSPGGERYDAEKNFSGAAPGAQYAYSNIASGLAALVVEDAVGKPFAAYTKDKIFEPLDMNSTAWFLAEIDREKFATPYERKEDGSFAPYDIYALATWPDGGLRTSARDLATYLSAVINKGELGDEEIFPRAVYGRLLSPIDLRDTEDLPRNFRMKGLFWSGRHGPASLQQRTLIGHNGSDPGVTTLMYFDPITDRGAIALANADFDNVEELRELYRLFYRLFEVELSEE